jgi:CheY-like chemotaxis protein
MTAGPTILVIDDDRDTRELYALSLSVEGFTVETARNGMEGLTRAAEALPAVIVTDLAMPGCDGWELIGRFKTHPRTNDIPVVVVTGWLKPPIQNERLRTQCAAFLTKPCTPDVLARELRHVLDERGGDVYVKTK